MPRGALDSAAADRAARRRRQLLAPPRRARLRGDAATGRAPRSYLDRAADGSRRAGGRSPRRCASARSPSRRRRRRRDPTYAIGLIRGPARQRRRGRRDRARAQALAAAAPGAPAAQLALGDVLAAAARRGRGRRSIARAADLALRRADDAPPRRCAGPWPAARARRRRRSRLYLAQNPQVWPGRACSAIWQVEAGEWSAAIETLEGVRRRIGNRDAALLVRSRARLCRATERRESARSLCPRRLCACRR